MKQLPTPLRLLLMLCICLLAFSPAAYAACPHSTCPDGSCNIDSSYDNEGGYVGKPVGDRPVHFDTINICGDELCWDGNCGDTPTEDDDAERLSCRASSVLSRPTTYWQRWNSISRR